MLIRESRFNSFYWAVWVVWFILVVSHSSKLRIDHRLFFKFLTLLGSFGQILRSSLNGMDWLGNQISRFIRLGLQEWQFGEFGLFWLVLTHPS